MDNTIGLRIDLNDENVIFWTDSDCNIISPADIPPGPKKLYDKFCTDFEFFLNVNVISVAGVCGMLVTWTFGDDTLCSGFYDSKTAYAAMEKFEKFMYRKMARANLACSLAVSYDTNPYGHELGFFIPEAYCNEQFDKTIQLFYHDISDDFDAFIGIYHLNDYISISDLIADDMVWYSIRYTFSDSITGKQKHTFYLHDYTLTVADEMASYITSHFDDITHKINNHYLVDNLFVMTTDNDDVMFTITVNYNGNVDCLVTTMLTN